jgi:hypothetical protein
MISTMIDRRHTWSAKYRKPKIDSFKGCYFFLVCKKKFSSKKDDIYVHQSRLMAYVTLYDPQVSIVWILAIGQNRLMTKEAKLQRT